MRRATKWAVGLLLIVAATSTSSRSSIPLTLQVPFRPEIVTLNGRPMIYYELQVRNLARDTLALQKLLVLDAADSTVVATFDQRALQERSSAPSPWSPGLPPVVAPGATTLLYLEVTLPLVKTPTALTHRLQFTQGFGSRRQSTQVQGAPTAVGPASALHLGPPLREGPWCAVYEPAWQRGHRRVRYTVADQARIPGRWAIDFIKLDQEGRYARAEEDVVKNWYGYGESVLAVAAGVVKVTRNDFPESATLSAHPSYPAEQATGNYLALDIGNNRTVFYEHLKPGSLRVKPGERVRAGQVLAQVGFTGQTTGPHLHLHVANAASALGAEGLPFAFAGFRRLGNYSDFTSFGKRRWTTRPDSLPATVANERPTPNAVIEFGPGSGASK